MDLSQIENYKFFISATGREEIKAEIKNYQKEYGKKWLVRFKTDFPDLIFLIDLIANHSAPDAFLYLKKFISDELETNIDSFFTRMAAKTAIFGFLEANISSVFQLHSELRTEIDRKQF